MVQAQAFEEIVAVAKESVWGTGVAPTLCIPVTGSGGGAQFDVIYDEGRRGLPSADFGACLGNGHGEFSMESLVYPVEIGPILSALLGTENITGAADPYTHTFTAAITPPSWTFEDQVISGANGAMRFAGGKCTSATFTWENESGAVTVSSQWMSMTPTKVTGTNPAVSTTLGCGYGGWQTTVTSTGITGRVLGGEFTLSRELQMVYTGQNVASPAFINNAPLRYEGTLTVMADSLADFDRVLADTRQSLAIQFSYNSTPARSLTFTSTSTFFAGAPVEYDRSALGVIVKVGFRGLHNTTDSGVVKAVALNSRATVY